MVALGDQTALTVHLVVKGSPRVAKEAVIQHLNAWLLETPNSTCLPGLGFPPKALLFYCAEE